MRLFTLLLATVLACALTPAQAAVNRAAVERSFQTWLAQTLWPQARARNVSRATFKRATSGLTLEWDLPDLQPPGAPPERPQVQRQSEFRSPSRYFRERNLATLTALGRVQYAKWADTLKRVEAQTGVPGRIVIAIWGRETGYGRAALPHNALRVLTTQAFMGRRRTNFLEQSVSALVILEEDHFPGSILKSSWAGALGGPQFMPATFLTYAVDFDGDGKRDIWNSVPDMLASIAHYLEMHGWRAGRDWGYQSSIPPNISCALEGPEQYQSIAQWVARGVKRVSGKPFPDPELKRKGALLMPVGRYGPAFIATPNFYVIKAYNESDAYALFIGHLADRIAYGSGRFDAAWDDPTSFGRRDVQKMQERLEKAGYDVGGADGLVGFKTRTAIGTWQERHGLRATCYPDAKTVRSIR